MEEINRKLKERGLNYSIRKVENSKRLFLFKGETKTSVKFNDMNGVRKFFENIGIYL